MAQPAEKMNAGHSSTTEEPHQLVQQPEPEKPAEDEAKKSTEVDSQNVSGEHEHAVNETDSSNSIVLLEMADALDRYTKTVKENAADFFFYSNLEENATTSVEENPQQQSTTQNTVPYYEPLYVNTDLQVSDLQEFDATNIDPNVYEAATALQSLSQGFDTPSNTDSKVIVELLPEYPESSVSKKRRSRKIVKTESRKLIKLDSAHHETNDPTEADDEDDEPLNLYEPQYTPSNSLEHYWPHSYNSATEASYSVWPQPFPISFPPASLSPPTDNDNA